MPGNLPKKVLDQFGHGLFLLLGSVVGWLSGFVNPTDIGNVDAVCIVTSCTVRHLLKRVRINGLSVSLDYNVVTGVAPLLYLPKIAKYALPAVALVLLAVVCRTMRLIGLIGFDWFGRCRSNPRNYWQCLYPFVVRIDAISHFLN